MDETTQVIVAKKLAITKSKQPILKSLDFEIKRGTITGLIGPSGSGKTTLMRTLVGVQKISSGELSIFNVQAGNKSLRSRIGYVTQSPAVYGDLTVEQNVKYFATIAKASKRNVEKVIAQVHLQQQTKQIVDSLSGGQRARVSLAIALLGNPELLILDEPTVGLDPVLRKDLWALFQTLADGGKTLLVSSHVMDEAERCQELLLLRDGKLLWNDTKQALLQKTHTHDVGAAFIAMIEGGKL